MVLKVYRIDKFKSDNFLINLLLFILAIVLFIILIIPLLLLGLLALIIYFGYKVHKQIKNFIKKLKTKKIKIEDNSNNGEVIVKTPEKIPIITENMETTTIPNKQLENIGGPLTINKNVNINNDNINNINNNINTDINNNTNNNLINKNKNKKYSEETETFVNYLLNKGLTLKDNIIYYLDKSVYPVYKKTYPVNEIIRLYEIKPEEDIIILGLKGTPDNPKRTYLIPTEKSKERMSISDLGQYMININNL